jgi:hypothetical protein
MAGTLNGQHGANASRHVVVGYKKGLESVRVLLPLLVVWTVVILELHLSHVNAIILHAQVSKNGSMFVILPATGNW